MGCYLSAPDDNVYVTEGRGKNFSYTTASCQGWRRKQEDAEDCLPFYDDDASLFILCDGHGGSEVAQYTVKHFPTFLKNHDEYKKGNYEKALEEAFIEFDKHLRTPKVLEKLENLAMDLEGGEKSSSLEESCGYEKPRVDEDTEMKDDGPSVGSSGSGLPTSSSSGRGGEGSSAGPSTSAGPSSSNGPTSVAEEVDSETLKREAHMPIDELIRIHSYTGPTQKIKGRAQSLRHGSFQIGRSPVIRPSQKDDNEDEVEGSVKVSAGSSSEANNTDQPGPSESAGECPTSSSGSRPEFEMIRKAMEHYFNKACDEDDDDDDNDEDDSEFDVSEMDDDDSDEDEEDDEDSDDEDDDDFEEDSDSVNEDEDGDDECEDDAAPSGKSRSKKLRKKHRRSALEHSSSSESGDDESQDGSRLEDEELEDGNNVDDDEERQKLFYSRQSKAANRLPIPGIDSGCTAVVALIKSGTLYVASAGDSRCIVIMYDGRCKAMSFDHKPEDEGEMKRIHAAKGSVSDGRVNGGLNLSRAFGDFNYKDVNLDPREQMITALPDVKTLKLDFKEVEFIFLACDGIWNSMNNGKVAKFMYDCKRSYGVNLSKMCIQLFQSCLAPSTEGDGTGCDNMTCILVKFHKTAAIEDSQVTEQNDLKTTMRTIDGSGDRSESNKPQIENNNQNDDQVDGTASSTGKRSADFDDEMYAKKFIKRKCLRLLEDDHINL